MDRAELIRRLKAARALGGFTKPEALAMQPLLVENGIKESRIRELESMKGRADARPMELAIIARACGLPEEFFSASFERMSDPGPSERLVRLEQAVTHLAESMDAAVDEIGSSRVARAVRDAGQASEPPAEQSPGQRGARGSSR